MIRSNAAPVYTFAQAADRLVHGDTGQAVAFGIAPGGTLGVDMSGLPAEGQQVARLAFQAWTDLTGLRFDLSARSPDIVMDDRFPGAYAETGFTTYPTVQMTSARVNVSTDWLNRYGTDFNSYSHFTYVHEIGHALGLNHAGDYNVSAVYGQDNIFANDSWQVTVMSYFSQRQNTFTDASYAYVATPMAADVLAIRTLYGTALLRTGDTVYGDGSTAGGIYDLLIAEGLGGAMAWTIVDDGGFDTLDMRSSGANQVVDLRPEHHSSVFGLTGNLTIAPGTTIERVMTGAGRDIVYGFEAPVQVFAGAGADTVFGGTGNDELHGEGRDANLLLGHDGNDTIFAGAGDDFLAGGTGNDALYGGAGHNTIYLGLGDDLAGGGAGDDLIFAGAGNNRIWGGLGNDTVHGGTGRDAIVGGGNGANLLLGNGGNDTIFAGAGDDFLAGGTGNDALYGGTGHNTIYLGLGDDLAGGGAGDDLIFAGAGNNRIWGGFGDDTIVAGSGRDILHGGPGADTFVFASAGQAGIGAARDVILDFAPGIDRIDLSALSLTLGRGDAFGGTAGELLSIAGFVLGDLDGDGAQDFTIQVNGAPVLGAADFIL